ncbi:MAG TPA: signal peptide peptidase SppA [Cyclobacteriaceae bacterium]|jgi:protease-4
MGFFKAFLSSCLGALVAMIIFAILVIAIIAGMTGEKQVIIEGNSILHISLDDPINELEVENPLAGLPLPGSSDQNIGVLQLIRTIEHARDDDKISGILLEVEQPQASISTLDEIRDALFRFRDSGKWVIAYSANMSEGAYFVATAADKIYMNPEGRFEFNGLTAQFMSFKKLLDKLSIHPQVFRVGEFKSAVEPFLMEKMSPENRQQLSSIIESIHGHILQRVSEGRGIPVAELKRIADNSLARDVKQALSLNLIDSALYSDDVEEILMGRVGVTERDQFKLVKYGRYRKSFSLSQPSRNEIAVIVAEGTILPGRSDDQTQPLVGAETYVKLIRRARLNDRVKAIVLRVNSTGGEFQASDMIWRELKLASEVKPVIASMGDYAASGGYYLAMACDTIVARPATITGSIGIFGVMFDLSEFFDEKLGITFDEVRTGKFGEMFTVTRPLTAEERAFWQQELEESYETFLEKAAEGRNMTKDDVRAVAAGRVWSGSEAADNGLVDVLGGFDEAVQLAAERAGVADDYRLRYYPERKSFLEMWLEQAQEDQARVELGELHRYYNEVKKLSEYQGAQARLPFEFVLD